MNTIFWSRKAQKQLLKIAKPDALAIYDKVDSLKWFPDCRNVKQLKNHKHSFRLKVGRYRVLFDHDGSVKVVSIEEVKKRDERTY